MFANAVHHRWKEGQWQNIKTGEIRKGRYLYNREYDVFAVKIDGLYKTRTNLDDLNFGLWEYITNN